MEFRHGVPPSGGTLSLLVFRVSGTDRLKAKLRIWPKCPNSGEFRLKAELHALCMRSFEKRGRIEYNAGRDLNAPIEALKNDVTRTPHPKQYYLHSPSI